MSGTRKLGRPTAHRTAMLRCMVTFLLEKGRIETTVTRAKEVAPVAEKMITLAKKNDLPAYRQALGFITKEDVAKKLFQELGPKYAERNGGYTRVVRIGPRRGDAAEMAIIQLV
mgnify:CR=1 FL=1